MDKISVSTKVSKDQHANMAYGDLSHHSKAGLVNLK